MRLIILSGRSGSGKTIVLHTLEDLGFYCVDNLPLLLLDDLQKQLGSLYPKIAISIDARNLAAQLAHFEDKVKILKENNHQLEVVFLDADENTLLKRFSETRRKHPLTTENITLREAIRQEHNLLTPIADLADLVIDTSELSLHSLSNLIRERIGSHKGQHLQVLVQSFGFKHGLPSDTDFVFDIRCLPNPYWMPDLRKYSGLDKPVIDFLNNQVSVKNMLTDIIHFLNNWIPKFKANNRSYLTISIGCTGGQHRSVYMSEAIVNALKPSVDNIQVRHRELVNTNL